MNKTILIIDDDDVLRAGLVRGLQGADFNTLTAESAESASEILNRINPDAIVLDRMMVSVDGLTFLKKIRGDGNNTPVIMLTAMSGADNTIDGLSGGANDYLTKPFKLQELVLRLHNITRNEKRETKNELPSGLMFADDEFFVNGKLLGLSGEEKRLLTALVSPVGNTVIAAPMVAKRLRIKINSVLSNVDIATVRGKGYKLMCNLQSAL